MPALPGGAQSRGNEQEMPGQVGFPRSERLRTRSEYAYMYKHGRKLVDKAFICYVVRNTGQGRKFGLTVSRKVGGAVTRNRVKRYIREAYRANRQRMDESCSVVIIARPSAATLSCQECASAIGALFDKGGVIRE
jgi:ribonuclease P protein component